MGSVKSVPDPYAGSESFHYIFSAIRHSASRFRGPYILHIANIWLWPKLFFPLTEELSPKAILVAKSIFMLDLQQFCA